MYSSADVGKKQAAPKTKFQDKRALYLHRPSPSSDNPVIANFDSQHLTIGAGVAIFHLATSRVVVCRHSINNYWFLPKGRRDVNEDTCCGAEREGYEESGYRNRVIPLPISHRQPKPHLQTHSYHSVFASEPIWTQLAPVSHSAQYILFWYIAETVPPEVEVSMGGALSSNSKAYQQPPRFPTNMTLAERIALEPEGYQPVRHANTAANSEEALYESCLLPVDEAMRKLEGTISADVVRRGWAAICLRREIEDSSHSLNPDRTQGGKEGP